MKQNEDSLLREKLKEYFGFSSFKGNQEAVIRNVLSGKDTFVLMPTGGGKSLCYQLPALLMDGVAIVISPLIALMKNQVDAMRTYSNDAGIAHFLNSSLNKSAIAQVRNDVLEGRTKLLYFAPESLTKEDNVAFLRKVKVSFYAIDEAHCISEWGHAFRPEYRRIRPIINEIGTAPLIALTATATPKVQMDIQKNLGMSDASVFKSSFNRPNLYYEIRPKHDVDREIIRYIKQHEGKSGIIYCLSRKKVEELTGGSVVVDVQASGVLGSENDVLDAILGGSTSIDISRISAFALTSYGCNKSKLLSIPFTFENRAHFWNFANSELAPEFLNEPQELGLPVRGIFYGEEGFRHFFTVKPVSGIADFKGLKLRVSNDPVMNGMVESLGANPTVVSFGELYSALQTGVVDGAEQPIANYKSNAFPEVANNLILDGHTLGAVQAVITDNAWGKLTENQQAAIMEAGADTQAFNAELSETAENKVLDELKSSGCNVVDVPDKAPWQEACAKVISENTSDQAELYQQLLDMKA